MTAVIVDRPNVPADLVERYWYARDMQPSQAGQLGSTARITMAPGELPIAAGDGLVGAATNGELFSRDRQSVLRVFDVRSGVSIMELPTTLYLEHGAFAGGYLFWSGTDPWTDRPQSG